MELISREQAVDALRGYLVGKRCPDDGTLTCRLIENEVINKLPTIHPELSTNLAEVGTDCISRQAAIDALKKAYWDKNIQSAKDDPCIVDAMTDWAIRQIKALPSTQPGQRYTNEELEIFQHGISLSLLSKRSAQHWRYDENRATEIKFLERLYEKVSANMRGGQNE